MCRAELPPGLEELHDEAVGARTKAQQREMNEVFGMFWVVAQYNPSALYVSGKGGKQDFGEAVRY
jgi:hypothetical protein